MQNIDCKCMFIFNVMFDVFDISINSEEIRSWSYLKNTILLHETSENTHGLYH